MELAVQPGVSHKIVARSPGKNFEVDFGVGVGRNDVNQPARFKFLHNLPAAHQGFGAEQAPRIDFAVRCETCLSA